MTDARRKCPICQRPRSPAFAPFCSKRCKDRDLLRWLGDGYALPGPPALDPEEDKA
ncbi:MAG: DNA gyrase inhibitor YacG [Sphingomonadales bacterium]|nr:DNA gyrase inhibitor YacG [Sphingomonadales bacterium]